MDSLALGKPWYVMEHGTPAVQWKPLNTRKRGGELLRDSLAHVAMGADAINFFQWRQSRSGAEAFHSAMVPHAGEDTKVLRGVCELGETLAALSDAGLQGTELKRSGTAILFSAESEWATRSETLPSMKLDHWHDVRDWDRGLLDAGVRADVTPLAYDWSGYATIVLPSVLILSDEDVRRIADFTASGGRAVVRHPYGDGEAVYVGCDLDRQGVAALAPAIGFDADANPRVIHTVRASADGVMRFDFYLNRTRDTVELDDVAGEPIVMRRTEFVPSGADGDGAAYALRRNAILVTRAVER